MAKLIRSGRCTKNKQISRSVLNGPIKDDDVAIISRSLVVLGKSLCCIKVISGVVERD